MNTIFAVIYEVDKSVEEFMSVTSFIITDSPGNIIDVMNHRISWRRHRLFSNFYEAVKFVEEKFDFEDLFEMNIVDVQQIQLNHGYHK